VGVFQHPEESRILADDTLFLLQVDPGGLLLRQNLGQFWWSFRGRHDKSVQAGRPHLGRQSPGWAGSIDSLFMIISPLFSCLV
jgi:hypothetical protein